MKTLLILLSLPLWSEQPSAPDPGLFPGGSIMGTTILAPDPVPKDTRSELLRTIHAERSLRALRKLDRPAIHRPAEKQAILRDPFIPQD